MPKFASYARSDIGKVRTNNEDACGAVEPQDRRILQQSGRLYVVADGMGGHEQGEQASNFAVQTLLKGYYQAPQLPPEERLRNNILQINQSLLSYTQEHLQPGEKMGTTMVVAVVRRDHLSVANVGDSRAYLLRGQEIRQITNDHSLVAELVRAGSMTPDEAAQSKHRNLLSRSVGVDPKLEVDIFSSIPLREGDVILLCSDGLSQYVSAPEILEAAHGSPQEIVERLILLANERGGSDNITVSVVRHVKEHSLPFGLSGKVLALIGLSFLALLFLLLVGLFALARWTSFPVIPTATIPPDSIAYYQGLALPAMTGNLGNRLCSPWHPPGQLFF